VTWGDVLTLALIAGVIVAIWLGRRKGRKQYAAAMSAARAEGHAQATAELSAKLVQQVHVSAGNSLPGEVGRESDAIIAALRYLAVESERASMRNLDRYDGGDDLAAMLAERRSSSGPDEQFAREWRPRGVDSWPPVVSVDRGEA